MRCDAPSPRSRTAARDRSSSRSRRTCSTKTLPAPLAYQPAPRVRSGPDPERIGEVARVLVEAKRPVIYAGQGVHYAQAWPQLRALAELLEAPVTTSLQGKSAFPENHPLALGSGGRAIPKPVHHFLAHADVIFGIGCSFAATTYGVAMPSGKTIIHATLDPADINHTVPVDYALAGDAGAHARCPARRGPGAARWRRPGTLRRRCRRDCVGEERPGLTRWQPKLSSDEVPLSPYRVIRDLLATVDVANTIITHDAGSPRDQLSPFWVSQEPLSYLGWGKTTQLGYGLGLAMGAKLAKPDKLCINVWGDAAIGFTGMDFETAVRERLPILSILLNNFSMAIELPIMQQATAKYRSTDISGDYAAFARALGGYGERVTEPGQIVPAIQRAIRQTAGRDPRAAGVHHRAGDHVLDLWLRRVEPTRHSPRRATGARGRPALRATNGGQGQDRLRTSRAARSRGQGFASSGIAVGASCRRNRAVLRPSCCVKPRAR